MKLILNFLFAGLFMNFGYPELIYQYNKIKFNDSLVEKLNQIDINDLILNTSKYIDQVGNFNYDIIEESSKYYKENPVSNSDIPNDEVISTVSLKNIPNARSRIITESKKHIGVPYSFGSKDPKAGFDCSGYVSYVYQKAINQTLPSGSKNQFSSGEGLMLNYDQLNPGDLMFFSFNGTSIQHVGIFIDEDHFIHSPSTGRRICIDKTGRYWKQYFVKGKSFVQ
tara:strand:+ start:62 stop:733 length:672 start_codon:yes stop_codon:yes gene_type:complete